MSSEATIGLNELVKSISIENMMNQREQVANLVREAHCILRQADTLAQAAHLDAISLNYEANGRNGHRERFIEGDGAEKLLRKLDGAAWRYLMEESGLRTFMDAKARKEWDESVYNGTYPPFTFDNIKQTFCSLYLQRGEMFDRGVLEVYKGLSWDYKTNQPFRFGKRIILNYFGGSYVYGSSMDKVDDLHRVFCVLDGKQEPDYRDGISAAIRRQHYYDKAGEYHGTYFDVRWFKKGTGHILFKREDLVRQCNRILHRHYPNALAAAN